MAILNFNLHYIFCDALISMVRSTDPIHTHYGAKNEKQIDGTIVHYAEL